MVGGAKMSIAVAKEGPFIVGIGEETKVTVEGIVISQKCWGVFKFVGRDVGWGQRYEGGVVGGKKEAMQEVAKATT